MKIAQFIYPGSLSGLKFIREEQFTPVDMVRVSEWVEVEFPQLPNDVTVPNQIAVIDRQITEQHAQNHRKIRELETIKANLLSLPAVIS